jgi:hypothetical protein
VSVPVRWVPGFAVTENDTLPLPVVLEVEVMVIHGTLLEAVHAQSEVVVTETLAPAPAFAGSVWAVALNANVHWAGAAACVTANSLSAICMVPVRAGPVLAATENDTDPFPVPLGPPVIVIQEASGVAVHKQAAPAVTETGKDPPAAGANKLVGLIA